MTLPEPSAADSCSIQYKCKRDPEQTSSMGYTPHVVVVGGGVFGTAIARDFAIRGLEVTLLEQGTLTAGTTGRMHGVLYSGARFASTDPAATKRCRKEARVLRSIASHCLEETSGVIAELPGQAEAFEEQLAACDSAGVQYQELSGEEIADSELNSDIQRAIRVPDAAIDPFQLTLSTAKSARTYGAEIKTGAEVCDIVFEDGRVAGVTVEHDPESTRKQAPTEPVSSVEKPPDEETDAEGDEDGADTADVAEDEEETEVDSDQKEMPGEVQREFPGASDDGSERGETEDIEADFVVNATGAWADRIGTLAGIELPLSRTRGRMLVVDDPPEQIITRQDTEPPLSLSPFWGNAVLGPVPVDDRPVEEAVDEIAAVVPGIEESSVLRSYAGVWTKHAGSSGSTYGPGAAVIDHNDHDDRWGMMSVIGGTVTTHRAIAKHVVDRVCSEFGIDRDCLTAEIELPELSGYQDSPPSTDSPSSIMKHTKGAMGSLTGSADPDPVLCETRSVRQSAIQNALDSDDTRGTDLTDVRIRTRATMGSCQGGRCGHRIAAQLYPDNDPDVVEQSLESLLANRWQGRRETLRGDQLAAAVRDYQFHATTLNRDGELPEELDPNDFDEGRTLEERERPTCCEAVIP